MYEPAYIQLANILRRQVATGVFRPEDQLPSEAMLYQISPMTVRRTINLSVDEGVVITAKGRGTFVNTLELSRAAFDLQDLRHLFNNPSMTVTLLNARIVAADERTAHKLDISVGAKTIYIRRLLSLDNDPALYHREYLIYDPTRPIVEAEMEVTALKGLFDGTGNALLKYGLLLLWELRMHNKSQIARTANNQERQTALIQHVAELREQDALTLVHERLRQGDDPLAIVEDCQEGMRRVAV